VALATAVAWALEMAVVGGTGDSCGDATNNEPGDDADGDDDDDAGARSDDDVDDDGGDGDDANKFQ
jgi:hypothetical protein